MTFLVTHKTNEEGSITALFEPISGEVYSNTTMLHYVNIVFVLSVMSLINLKKK
jgi:hypothetical protein